MKRLAITVCAATCLLAPGCTVEPEPESEPPSPAAQTGLPESFACTKTKSVPFTAAAPASTPPLPDVAPNGDPAPTVTNAREITDPWGANIVIEGTGFGTGGNGAYVSFGEGAREMRVPISGSTTSTRISVIAPLGAEGKIAVHTGGGTADAGTFSPAWRASAVLTFEKGDEYGQTLASIDTTDATYVMRSTSRTLENGTSTTRVTLSRFTADAVTVAVLDGIGFVSRAMFAPAPNGEVDLAFVAQTSHLHVAHVRADAVDVDDGCVPAESTGPLAFARSDAGRVAWATTTTNGKSVQHVLVRLVDAGGTGTWKLDRAVVAKEIVRGDGVELADGSVGFAWGEGAGAFLDAKSAPHVAFLPAGATEIESMALASAMDDYVQTRTFATSNGLVMTYCNTDDTGFLDDSSSSGVNCHVLSRTGSHDWDPFDGYPSSFKNVDYDFGFVAGHVAAVHRVAGSADTHVYRATVDATPSAITVGASKVSFVPSQGAAPVLLVARGAQAMVVRSR